MSRSQVDLLALKDELTNDPNGLGLVAPPAVDDVGNADKLNEILETQQVDRKAIPVNELAQKLKRSEWNALSLADRQLIQVWFGTGSIDVNDTGQVKAGLLEMFAPETATRSGMASLLTQAVNRVEQMFRQGLLEIGGYVTPSDIAQARQAT